MEQRPVDMAQLREIAQFAQDNNVREISMLGVTMVFWPTRPDPTPPDWQQGTDLSPWDIKKKAGV